MLHPTVQGEKAGCIPQLLRAWAEEVKVGAKCQTAQSHLCLRPSLIYSGGAGGIQNVFTYLMNSHRNTIKETYED
jgi:hypothetical protein